jgi:hypothetical protein
MIVVFLIPAVLRKFPPDVHADLLGNRFETTIFCITSGVVKLSKTTRIPPNRRLYRGLGGMVLPPAFWKPEVQGLRGGVEKALMSTTTKRSLALQYSGRDVNRGTIFEITTGRIDIGASLNWVSQYPQEEEFLFPPLCCLEVTDEPRIEDNVIVVPLRVNANLKGLTLEQLVERRKVLHLAMAKNMREELDIWVSEECAMVSNNAAIDGQRQDCMKRVLSEYDMLVDVHSRNDAQVFNDDKEYKIMTEEAIEAKAWAIKKIKLILVHFDTSRDTTRGQAVSAMLEDLMQTPLRDFESEWIMDKVRTGAHDFPWQLMNTDQTAIELGRWRPDGHRSEQFEAICQVMSKRCRDTADIRAVGVGGHQISIKSGLRGKEVTIDIPEVEGIGGIVELLLVVLTNVNDYVQVLDFRYTCPFALLMLGFIWNFCLAVP